MELSKGIVEIIDENLLNETGSWLVDPGEVAYLPHDVLHLGEGVAPDEGILHRPPAYEVVILPHLQQSSKPVQPPQAIVLRSRLFRALYLQLQLLGSQCAFDAVRRDQLMALLVDPFVVLNHAPLELTHHIHVVQLQVALYLRKPVRNQLGLRLRCNQ